MHSCGFLPWFSATHSPNFTLFVFVMQSVPPPTSCREKVFVDYSSVNIGKFMWDPVYRTKQLSWQAMKRNPSAKPT